MWIEQALNAGGELSVSQPVFSPQPLFRAVMTWPDKIPMCGLSITFIGAIENLNLALMEYADDEMVRQGTV